MEETASYLGSDHWHLVMEEVAKAGLEEAAELLKVTGSHPYLSCTVPHDRLWVSSALGRVAACSLAAEGSLREAIRGGRPHVVAGWSAGG